ncbi:MAG: HAD-IC family P-type ATPase [Cellulomonadaceae bacterium]|jgi:magnesium-transporting ATPase (P-type)|nr:HAD-IC family P-type ATPase [Cellulomonadaceae bacterium]
MVAPWANDASNVLAEHNVTAEAGLTSAEAARRLATHGLNKLPEPKKTPWYVRLAGHMKNVIIIILLIAAVAKFLLGSYVDGWVLLVVVAVTISIGMVQEGRAEKSLDAIKKMLSLNALALRDGQWTEIDAETLVPGDVIRIKAGDRAPADARIIDTTNLQIEEAALTGESVPAEKTVAPLDERSGLGDRTNMLFSSTIIVAGTGTAVITGTGADTEIGRIQDLMASATHEETPLSRTMDKFGKNIAVFVIALAVVMSLVGWLVHNMSAFDIVSSGVAVAAAAIPEGLSAVVTIALAMGVAAMAQRKSISRNLTSTETLGAVSTICSDKTGTLTQNEMTVRVVRTHSHEYAVGGTGYAPFGDITVDGNALDSFPAELISLSETSVLCNESFINEPTEVGGLWTLTGEPTEGSMYVLGRKTGFTGEGWTRLAEIPFDSANKYMATLNEDTDGNRHVFVKGALGQVMDRCTTQLGANGVEALDTEFWHAEMTAMAKQGLRVLAAARMDVARDVDGLTAPENGGPQGLTLVGIVGIVDPPRPEAIQSIAEAHAASIDVKMITGDHVITAKAIAEEMGITHGEANALTGPELEAMSDEDLAAVVRDVHVFARVSPEHKIRIVRALQTHGEIVAMTGDGVNDAPALSQANVGVAMGVKGTEATKAAADLILLDDNFSTIEKAIFEGRRVFDNIKKCAMFALPANVAQTTGILLASFLGWRFVEGSDAITAPLTPTLILWLNMVVAVCLDLTFASEPGEPGLMRRRPRDTKEPLITKRYARHIFIFGWTMAIFEVGIFLFEMNVVGSTLVEARSAALSMLMLAQVAHVFNVRRINSSSFTWDIFRGNKTLGISLIILAVAHMALMYIPAMNQLFGIVPTSLRQWAIIIPSAFVVFCAIEGLKYLFKKGEDKVDARRAAAAAASRKQPLAA